MSEEMPLLYPNHATGVPLESRMLHLVAAWLSLAGYDMHVHCHLGAALAGSSKRPDLMAAAMDVLVALKSTPNGRQALADFLGQPVFQDAKGE